MDKPRLKLNDKEVGLRDLGDGLFEPKNLKVLEEVFHGYYQPKSGPNFFVENHITKEEPEKYHKIQSFCFVVTENIKREGAMMLKSLRKFHDQPVYIICDYPSKRFLVEEGLKDDTVFCELTSKEELEKINEEIFKDHKCIANNIHRPAEILRKMDVMNFALKHLDNTFFLDADIIVLDSLQEYFSAKVVLSPHYYPKAHSFNGFENGFYNAGYIFCASKGFPNFWKNIYLNDLYDSIYNKILKMPGNIRIYPGHDYGDSLTISLQENIKKSPLLRAKDLNDFKKRMDNYEKNRTIGS